HRAGREDRARPADAGGAAAHDLALIRRLARRTFRYTPVPKSASSAAMKTTAPTVSQPALTVIRRWDGAPMTCPSGVRSVTVTSTSPLLIDLTGSRAFPPLWAGMSTVWVPRIWRRPLLEVALTTMRTGSVSWFVT